MNRTKSQITDRGERDARLSGTEAASIIRRHAGGVGWPTVVLCGGLIGAYGLVAFGWWAGVLPLWAGCAINSVLAYAFYTVHHEANHKCISGRNARWKRLDTVCGSIAAVPLQLSFRGFSSAHLRHHSHTNDPLRDPDVQVAGPLWALPLKWLIAVVLGAIATLPRGDRLAALIAHRLGLADLPSDMPAPSDRFKAERRHLRRYSQVGMVVLLLSIPFGVFTPVFFLWWLPSRFAILILMVLFQCLAYLGRDGRATSAGAPSFRWRPRIVSGR